MRRRQVIRGTLSPTSSRVAECAWGASECFDECQLAAGPPVAVYPCSSCTSKACSYPSKIARAASILSLLLGRQSLPSVSLPGVVMKPVTSQGMRRLSPVSACGPVRLYVVRASQDDIVTGARKPLNSSSLRAMSARVESRWGQTFARAPADSESLGRGSNPPRPIEVISVQAYDSGDYRMCRARVTYPLRGSLRCRHSLLTRRSLSAFFPFRV